MEMILQLVEKKRVRTFYIHSFSGSCRYCQDQILICGLYLFIFAEGILSLVQQVIPPPVFSWHREEGELWYRDAQGGRRACWEPKAR